MAAEGWFLSGTIRMGMAHLRDFDGTGAADAFDVVIEDGTHLGAAGFAEHQKPNFHNGLVSPEERSLVASLLGMTILVGWSLQPVFLAFFEEGFAADAEGFGGATDLVMRRFERGGDDLTLHFLQRAKTADRAYRAWRGRTNSFGKICGLEQPAVRGDRVRARTRENHGSLEGVAKFADVARPGVGRKHAPRGVAQLGIGATVGRAQRRHKMVCKRQDIGAALAQRRNRKRKNIQAEIEVLAEAARFHGGGEIDVGESDEARLDAQRLRAAEAFERAFLQNAQKFSLRSGRERGDLIENDGAVAAELEAAELTLNRASESTALVAEEFAFDKLWRKAGAIDFQEGRVAAGAEFVNQARKVVLAGTALAGDQESGRRGGNLFGEFKETERGGILGDPRQSACGHCCERPPCGRLERASPEKRSCP